MNQIMRVGEGVLIAFEERIAPERKQAMSDLWREHMPDVKVIFVSEARIVDRGEITTFEFTGEVTPTFVAEFQRWWKEVNDGA